jgi:hypothetical protein
MQSFLLLLFGLAILGACIWLLHRIQLRRTVENADLAAPLDAFDTAPLPDLASAAAQPEPAVVTEDLTSPELILDTRDAVPEPVPGSEAIQTAGEPSLVAEPISAVEQATPAASPDAAPAANDNWLTQVRSLRESGALDAALDLSRAQFPKTQAFQQAAIILRQQMREALEKFQPVDALLLELYHTAALADLFRTSSSHKPRDPLAALDAVRTHTFQYAALGHLRLKLLNKSDVRALEQLWGAPATHRHSEDLLGDEWLRWCRAP